MEKDVLYLIFAWANNILHREVIILPKPKNHESCKVAGCVFFIISIFKLHSNQK